MKITAQGFNDLKNEEGFRGKPYKCAAGKWTVGFGTRIGDTEVEKYTKFPMSRQEAEQRAIKKCDDICVFLQKNVSVALAPHQVDALILFIYNIGETAFKGSTLLRKLNNRSFNAAALEFGRWVHDDHGNVIEGLVSRRQREAKRFMTPYQPVMPPKEEKK